MEHNHVASQTDRRGDPGTYRVIDLVTDDELLTIAQAVARQKLAKGIAITDKDLALQGLLQTRDREAFAALFLDNQHRSLAYEGLFLGTHPYGLAKTSQANIELTRLLQEALKLVDEHLLDHIVVRASGVVLVCGKKIASMIFSQTGLSQSIFSKKESNCPPWSLFQ
ncbi:MULTISPECIES: JAB domain-containing protein [Aeromonas]|uniref:JAB domain-containing protein n=1 Tax=Aeromonas TaxID=642 RepID=UPI0012F3516D|nr:JAB domain-containing protein [Aeromonas salmonicida]VXA80160.1 DNA repair protein RadC [Aeromonas salmonicida]